MGVSQLFSWGVQWDGPLAVRHQWPGPHSASEVQEPPELREPGPLVSLPEEVGFSLGVVVTEGVSAGVEMPAVVSEGGEMPTEAWSGNSSAPGSAGKTTTPPALLALLLSRLSMTQSRIPAHTTQEPFMHHTGELVPHSGAQSMAVSQLFDSAMQRGQPLAVRHQWPGPQSVSEVQEPSELRELGPLVSPLVGGRRD